jgi:hypothetical protein
VLRAGLVPEVMEEIGRNGAEDDEGQGCNPGLPSDNNQQTTARFQDRGQNGENVRIRQALRADRGGRRTKIHEFFDTRTDENKRHEDTADRQNRIVDASRGTDVRPHWTATHSGCGHRVAPCMNSHENALYDERFLPKPPRPSMTKIPPRINLVGDSNYPAPYCVPAEEIFMRNVGRKLAFVLAASNHGTMITNRFDYRMSGSHAGVGVGFQLLEAGAFDPIEVELALQLIEFRRRIHGAGVVAIDCGANIGIHTIEWATGMTGWGSFILAQKCQCLKDYCAYYAFRGWFGVGDY